VDAVELGRRRGRPQLGRLIAGAQERDEPARPEDRPHRRGQLEDAALKGREGREARVDRVLDGERQLGALELVEVDRPARLLAGGRLLYEHPAVVVEPHHLLEQHRVARGEREGVVDEGLGQGGAFFDGRREQRGDQRLRVGLEEGLEVDDRVAALSRARPVVGDARQLGSGRAHDEDGPRERLEQVAQERERVGVRRVQIVEHQADGAVRRVGLEERAHDGAPQQAPLDGVVGDGSRERALLEGDVEQLAEEIDHVADLAIAHDLRDLVTHGRAHVLGVHPLDEPEAHAQQAGEDAIRSVGVASAAAVQPRGERVLFGAVPDHELVDQAALAEPLGAEQGDHSGLAAPLDRLEGGVEARHLALAPDEGRSRDADQPERDVVLDHGPRRAGVVVQKPRRLKPLLSSRARWAGTTRATCGCGFRRASACPRCAGCCSAGERPPRRRRETHGSFP
jgi:hypothetical protein